MTTCNTSNDSATNIAMFFRPSAKKYRPDKMQRARSDSRRCTNSYSAILWRSRLKSCRMERSSGSWRTAVSGENFHATVKHLKRFSCGNRSSDETSSSSTFLEIMSKSFFFLKTFFLHVDNDSFSVSLFFFFTLALHPKKTPNYSTSHHPTARYDTNNFLFDESIARLSLLLCWLNWN